MIVLQDILDVINLSKGDTVEIQYELFQAAVTDLARLKQILFDFQSFRRNYRSITQSPGKALLQQFGFPKDAEVEPELYFNKRIVSRME